MVKRYAKMGMLILPIVLAACTEQVKEQNTDMQNQWKEISAQEIKNSVTLFDEDWMALAAGQQGDMNAMTISWGEIGVLWNKPVVTVYVSPDRYTYQFMEKNAYFTVTAFPEQYRSALQLIGTKSGRDGDKLKEAGLTPEFTQLGNPIFKEANLAIECRTIYSAPLDSANFDEVGKQVYSRSGMAVHKMYIGEIIHVWEK